LCTCCRHYPGAADGRSPRSKSPIRISLPRFHFRVGLHIDLFEIPWRIGGSDRLPGKVRGLPPPSILELTMSVTADQPEPPTAIRTDLGAIFVSLELSRSSWLSTSLSPQFRLFLHAGAYWLLWSMRRATPKRSTWRVMQFDTLRLRLIKIAARVVELKTQLKIHLPSSAPDQAIFALLLARLPRLVT
jgi:Transposase DDE domain group 1